MFNRGLFLLPLLAFLSIGCASYETRTYDVSVKNETNQPLTLWLTKNGDKYETGWKSPEELAMESPRNERAISGVIVAPGETAFTGPIQGEFAYNTSAYLRVYLGQLSINETLAVSRGSPRRVDVRLYPGKSDWSVFLQQQTLMVEPHH